MDAKHTPGPWTVTPTLTGTLSINKTENVPIATVGGAGWHLGKETAEANARLIAAAPDLLAALEEIAAADSGAVEWHINDVWVGRIARTAIAKIKGKSVYYAD